MRKIMKAKRRRLEKTMPAALLLGLAAAIGVQLLLLAAAAWLTLAGVIGEAAVPAAAGVCLLAAAFVGGLTAATAAPKLSLPTAAAVGMLLVGVNLALGRLLPEDGGASLFIQGGAIAAAVAAGILSALKKSGK